MYQLFIGCDMSKDKFDVSYFYQGNMKYLGEFVNDINGFKKMLTQIKSTLNLKPSVMLFCFENTGVYSKLFYAWLIEQKIAFKQENALQINNSLGIRRGKNDKADSRDIALYAYEKRERLELSKPFNDSIEKLRDLIARRRLLEKQKKALRVSLNVKKKTMNKQLYEEMKADNEMMLEQYDKLIKKAEKQMKQIINQDSELKENAKLVQSVVGIGPIITAALLVRTSNFTQITQSRKMACYAGIAPFAKSSGQKIGKARVSKIGDKYLKSLLSNGARAAATHDQQIKKYVQRKKKEGKHYGKIINAVKNKLLHRVFAAVNRGTPYVRFEHYA